MSRSSLIFPNGFLSVALKSDKNCFFSPGIFSKRKADSMLRSEIFRSAFQKMLSIVEYRFLFVSISSLIRRNTTFFYLMASSICSFKAFYVSKRDGFFIFYIFKFVAK